MREALPASAERSASKQTPSFHERIHYRRAKIEIHPAVRRRRLHPLRGKFRSQPFARYNIFINVGET